jgi:hypothetical protein
MKKFLLMVLAFSVTLQAHAYNCLDSKTGAEAGRIEELAPSSLGEEQWAYFYPGSSEYWTLKAGPSRELYNADRMVQHGREFVVGKIEMKAFYFQLTLNYRQMVCE